MSDLVVTPNYLDRLATIQRQTSDNSATAAAVAKGIGDEVWVTHGIVSGPSNVALADAESARRSVIEAMQTASRQLADKLGGPPTPTPAPTNRRA
ncbi:ESX-1 secretion-associated protein [Mycobacterium genavense]|uniref:ESX-1 secretion-associated protein n=1 Tax=Mycobacterium genavense TaxID=36812 RepID=UPI000684C661